MIHQWSHTRDRYTHQRTFSSSRMLSSAAQDQYSSQRMLYMIHVYVLYSRISIWAIVKPLPRTISYVLHSRTLHSWVCSRLDHLLNKLSGWRPAPYFLLLFYSFEISDWARVSNSPNIDSLGSWLGDRRRNLQLKYFRFLCNVLTTCSRCPK